MVKVDGGKRALVLEARAIRKDRSDGDACNTARMCMYTAGETVQKRARVVRFA